MLHVFFICKAKISCGYLKLYIYIGHVSRVEMSSGMSKNNRREMGVVIKVPAIYFYKCNLTKPITVCDEFMAKTLKHKKKREVGCPLKTFSGLSQLLRSSFREQRWRAATGTLGNSPYS